jgi:hypothetical protein
MFEQVQDRAKFHVLQDRAAGDYEDADQLREHAHQRRQRPAEESALPTRMRPEELSRAALVLFVFVGYRLFITLLL